MNKEQFNLVMWRWVNLGYIQLLMGEKGKIKKISQKEKKKVECVQIAHGIINCYNLLNCLMKRMNSSCSNHI